jgi:hypothetical protein
MTKPKKEGHHYISRFYLEGFVDPSDGRSLWVYDKTSGQVTRSTPRRAGLQKHFHSFTRADGSRDSTSVEDALAKIESQAAPVLRRLMGREPLDNRERSIAAYFMALMLVRVPAFRQGVERFKSEVVKRVTQLMAAHGRFDSVPVPNGSEAAINRAKETLKRGDFEVVVSPERSLKAFLAAEKVAAVIHSMTWVVVGTKGKHRYVTSDNPITYDVPGPASSPAEPVGLVHPKVELTFPLSAETVFVGHWQGPRAELYRAKATENMVRATNRRTAAGALRFMFASERSESLLNLVKKYRDSAPHLEVP